MINSIIDMLRFMYTKIQYFGKEKSEYMLIVKIPAVKSPCEFLSSLWVWLPNP